MGQKYHMITVLLIIVVAMIIFIAHL